MKYIITESRLNEFIKQYLDSWLSSKNVYGHESFIIIDSMLDDDSGDSTVMEYDHEDGRLWGF